MSSSVTYRQITFRLLPEKRSTWRQLEAMLDTQRCLYNAALEERIDCYRKTGKSLTYFDQAKSLTVCRKVLPDMAAVPVAIQRGTLKRLDHAFKGFFRRVSQGGAGFPRFQGRRHFNSLSVVSGVRVEGNRLRIPGLGWLTIRRRGGNPWPQGKPVSAVLKREEGRWKAVVCHAVSLPEPDDNGHAVGVDMNAGQVATSDGEILRLERSRRLEARARRYAKQLARQRRSSRRREKTRRRLAKTTRHMAMKRHDWQHHVSRRLADAAGWVVVEDLKVRTMTRSARRHEGGAGTPRAVQGGSQPRHPGDGLVVVPENAGLQGLPRHRGEPGLQQSNLCSVRRRKRPITQDAGPVSMRGVRPCGSRRPQSSGEHPGLGD